MLQWSDTLVPHPLWQASIGKPYQVTAAGTRARMISGRYTTQALRALYTKRQESPTCPLCGDGDEDLIHLIVLCPRLHHIRTPKLQNLVQLYSIEGMRAPASQEEICSAALNGSSFRCSDHALQDKQITLPAKCHPQANILCNNICHKLHVHRDIIINNGLMM